MSPSAFSWEGLYQVPIRILIREHNFFKILLKFLDQTREKSLIFRISLHDLSLCKPSQLLRIKRAPREIVLKENAAGYFVTMSSLLGRVSGMSGFFKNKHWSSLDRKDPKELAVFVFCHFNQWRAGLGSFGALGRYTKLRLCVFSYDAERICFQS